MTITKAFSHHYWYAVILVCATCFNPLDAQQADVFSVVKNNDCDALRKLLANGANANAADDDSDNVLIYAAMYASQDCMKALLDKTANANQKNKYGQTASMFCATDTAKLKLLMDHGADINLAAKSGNTTMLIASVSNQAAYVLPFLAANKANMLAVNNEKETALIRAAQFNDTGVLRFLIAQGIPINAKTNGAMNALAYAALHGNTSAALFLINNGAQVNASDTTEKITPLFYACLSHDSASVRAILEKTTGIGSLTFLGLSPLMLLAYSEHDDPALVQTMIDKGADIHYKAADGATALSWARKKGKTATVALLESLGAD